MRGETTRSRAPASCPTFQSTRPVRGETWRLVGCSAATVAFQSTRPVRGETAGRYAFRQHRWHFNPLAPCGARRRTCRQSHRRRRISIHSPRAGRDEWIPGAAIPTPKFQSTRPVRGETQELEAAGYLVRISIHSPRAGRDPDVKICRLADLISIHSPRAGRDGTPSAPRWGAGYFNPLAPCGARLPITSTAWTA